MDKQLYSANDPSTSCTKYGELWSSETEIEVWEICTFETIRQKLAYLTEYLNNYWTDFPNVLASVEVCMQIIKLT